MKYTNIYLEFPEDIPLNVKEHVKNSAAFLEAMVNFNKFKSFVIEGNYTNNSNEMFMSNEEIYNRLKEKDWTLKLEYKDRYIAGNRVMSHNDGIIKVSKYIINKSIPESSFIMAHEYAHELGFHHKSGSESPLGSFSAYLQEQGEKQFKQYYPKIKTPEKGKTLIEVKRKFPLCWFKELKWV